MGASREAAFSAFAKPALLVALVIVGVTARGLSLGEIVAHLPEAAACQPLGVDVAWV
jgi:formate hydrogenlyase subunit 4